MVHETASRPLYSLEAFGRVCILYIYTGGAFILYIPLNFNVEEMPVTNLERTLLLRVLDHIPIISRIRGIGPLLSTCQLLSSHIH